MVDLLTPVLTANWGDERAWKLHQLRGATAETGPAQGAADAARPRAHRSQDSGLRGRGGAGFPTGMKWSFIPQDNPKPSTWWSTPTSPSRAPARTSR